MGARSSVNKRSYVRAKGLCYRWLAMASTKDVVLYTLNNGTTDPT